MVAVAVAVAAAVNEIDRETAEFFMTKITIRRNGKELGQYAPEEIKGLVVTGELVSTDTVLHVSTGEWMSLASIAEFKSLFSGPQADAESIAGEKSGTESDSSLTAEEEIIESIKQWKWRKKKRGKVVVNVGLVLLLFTFFSVVQPIAPGLWVIFGVPGLALVIIGGVIISAAANGLPPGMTPPPGYTAQTSSYYGGGCSSCGSGGDSGGGDGGGDGGGCGGGGCGGGD